MRQVDQTEFSNEAGTVHGNCFIACIASLLEIELHEVPAFHHMDLDWRQPFIAFLNERGYDLRGSVFPGNEPSPFSWTGLLTVIPGVDGYFIGGGPSVRTYVSRGHAVIYKDGVMVFDPHPSRVVILCLEELYVIEWK